jgi:hypothetical protein
MDPGLRRDGHGRFSARTEFLAFAPGSVAGNLRIYPSPHTHPSPRRQAWVHGCPTPAPIILVGTQPHANSECLEDWIPAFGMTASFLTAPRGTGRPVNHDPAFSGCPWRCRRAVLRPCPSHPLLGKRRTTITLDHRHGAPWSNSPPASASPCMRFAPSLIPSSHPDST